MQLPKVGEGVVAIAFMGDHHLVVRESRPDEIAVFNNFIIEPVPPIAGPAGIGTYGLHTLKEALYELKERANDYDVVAMDVVACEHEVSYEGHCYECEREYERIYSEAVPA